MDVGLPDSSLRRGGPRKEGERATEEGRESRNGEEEKSCDHLSARPSLAPGAGASGWKSSVCTAREGRLGPEILRERDFQGDLEKPLCGAERGPALHL